MTTITVYTSADGAVRGFLASGHAGGKKIRGYDLVCCAVSALTQTGVNALEAVAKTTPVVEVRDGYGRPLSPCGTDISGASCRRRLTPGGWKKRRSCSKRS